MPIGGETIGTAFVRILASGRGFDQSVKDMFDDAEPEFEKGGADAEKAYEKGFAEEAKKNQNIKKSLHRTLNRAFGGLDARANFFGESYVERFTDKIVNGLKRSNPELTGAAEDLGKRISDAILKDFARTGELRLNLAARLEAALVDAAKDAEAARAKEDKARTQWEKEWRASLDRITTSIGKTLRASDQELILHSKTVTRVYDTIRTSHRDMARDWLRDNETIRREMVKTNDALVSSSERMDRFALMVGRAFGKGSRNNFLNFFGSVLTNLLRIPNLLTSAASGIGRFIESIKTTAQAAGGGLTGVAAGIGKVLTSLAATGAGIGGFVFLLGTLTSALLLAAGAAAALTASLAFGLVGALAPVVGLLGPLGLAVTGVATAFIGMDKAAKKATKEAFEPMTDQLKALGDAARPGILDGITAGVENMEGPMKRLVPLFKVVGDSIGNFIDAATTFSVGPGFERFVEVMTKTLPETMTSLGTIFGNTLDGIFGLFATLNNGPVQDLLGSLETLTARFSEWSISPGAERFFANAAESAKALLDFLGPVWDLTKQILDAGRGPGNELFRSMGDAVQGWVNAIKRDPNLLKDFFEDAQRMGEAIGHAVVAVGRLIGALDTATTRDFAIGIINGIAGVIEKVAGLIGWFNQLDGSIQGLIITAGLMLAAFRFGPLVGGLALFTQAIMNADDKLSILTGTLGAVVAGFAVGGPLGGALAGAAGLFTLLWREGGKATEALNASADGASDSVDDWEGLAESLNQVTGGFTKMTRAAIVAELETKPEGGGPSLADQWNELGLTTADVTDAMLGVPGAAAKVNGALSMLDGTLANDKAELDRVNEGLRLQQELGEAASSSEIHRLTERKKALTESIHQNENMRQSLDAGREALNREADSIRDTAAAAVDWRKELKGFPKAVITRFRAGDIPDTMKEVKGLISLYDLAPKQVRTLLETLGFEVTEKQIKKLIDWTKELDKQKPTPKIAANDTEFQRKAANARGALAGLTGFIATPTIHVDAEQALNMTDLVRQQMDYLDGLVSTSYVQVKNRGRVSGGDQEFGAAGGIYSGARSMVIGEAGPEALVPLSRPLYMVDPAVRQLSAIAQGLAMPQANQQVAAQKVVDVGGITVVSPQADPRAVASEMLNHLVAAAY